MEIRDYLRAIRRILPLLIILPIVAAAITGGFLELQPSKYQANATVVVPAISGNGSSQSAVSQYVSTFKDVLISQQVVNSVSQKFNIPVSELTAGLSASTITASSNVIHVVLVGTRSQNLTAAVKEATVESLDAIAQPRLVQAQNEVSISQTSLTNTNAAISTFDATTQNPSPLAKYNAAQSKLSNYETQLITAQIVGDKLHIAPLLQTIAGLKSEVGTDALQLQQWTALNNANVAALSAHNHATQALVAAEALVATDSAPGTVTTVDAFRLSKLADTIKFAAIAFALALLMLLGLLLILELMRSGRRAAAAKTATEEESAAGAVVPLPAHAEPALSEGAAARFRNPWRARSSAPQLDAVVASTNGNGNGNGHANGNGNGHAANVNGNGHAANVNGNGNGHARSNELAFTPDAEEAEAERTDSYGVGGR
jgi:capsular polysaccharide biosynthesis protein